MQTEGDASAEDASAGDASETPDWYAVHTHPRKESYADWHLRRQGLVTFFPHTTQWIGLGTRQARLVKRAWLTRYLFVRTAPRRFFVVNETPGVSGLVRARAHMPLPVPSLVMTGLQARADPYGEVFMPKAQKKRRAFSGRPGDRVRFTEKNPLFGFWGEIKRVLGSEVLVELEREILGKREARVPLAAIAEVLKLR